MKRKAISFLLGILVSLFCVNIVSAVSTITSYKFCNTKIIYMGEELDISNEKLLKLTTTKSESIYMPLIPVLDAMGYYTIWDSYDDAVVVSRYQKDIDNIVKRDLIDSSYMGKPIKNVSAEYLNNLSNTTWSNNNQNYYVAFKFLPDNQFEYIVKKHTEERFDIVKGSYTVKEGVIVFKRSEAYKTDMYGEQLAFAEFEVPERIKVKQSESESDIFYIGYSVNTQNFFPFVKE